MKKIRLNKQGEHLLPRPDSMGRSLKGDRKLECCIGIHEFCDGWIDIVRVSETHQVLYCRRCNLRRLIPLEVDTWEKLEAHMSMQWLPEEDR